jgi:hypothetical protein
LQDFGLPLKKLKKGIEFYHEAVEVYPIWLCPAKAMDVGNLFIFFQKSASLYPDLISRPIAPVSSVAGGDDICTRPLCR